MRSLFDMQASFADALVRPGRPAPAALARRQGKVTKKRFDVYRNNVAVGLIEALKATFPAVERLVGDDFFRAVARAYIEKEPPRSPLLFRYGETFGDFLDAFPPAPSVPYLGDVARLEWARLQAYHAPDRAPVMIEALGELSPEDVGQATFALHPSLALVRSHYPVLSLWAASTDRGSPEAVDMSRAEEAAILRPELEVDMRLLPPGGFYFMKALKEGARLEQAAEQAAKAAERTENFDLASHLLGLFQIGAVTAIKRELPNKG